MLEMEGICETVLTDGQPSLEAPSIKYIKRTEDLEGSLHLSKDSCLVSLCLVKTERNERTNERTLDSLL